MKKLAVFFPGIGYTVDKPLMHYSRKLAANAGFNVILLPYTGFPGKVKGDREKIHESYQIALAQSRKMLSDTDFSNYDCILFVGKSIGTIVAAEIGTRSNFPQNIHYVLYTPLEETFTFPFSDAIAFTGSADPWVKDRLIAAFCRQREIPCYVIQNANHSLETGDVDNDIDNLKYILKKTRKYIRRI